MRFLISEVPLYKQWLVFLYVRYPYMTPTGAARSSSACFQTSSGSRPYLIAAIVCDKYSVGVYPRPICTRCCLTMTHMIQVCINFPVRVPLTWPARKSTARGTCHCSAPQLGIALHTDWVSTDISTRVFWNLGFGVPLLTEEGTT